MISVLIPIYNHKVEKLVDAILEQSQRSEIPVEIICIDDRSKPSIKKHNEGLRQKFLVNYIEASENLGRAKVRNWLAKLSRYNLLLFLDCDSKIPDENFLTKYLDSSMANKVVYGGRIYNDKPPRSIKKRLHWKYGKKVESKKVELRRKHPYLNFMSNNFLIAREIFNLIKFDEQIEGYGYEDLVFAHQLRAANICITHIDNPVLHLGIEETAHFLQKTDKAIANLYLLNASGKVMETRLTKWLKRLRKYHLDKIIYNLLKSKRKFIHSQLLKEDPNLHYFSLYKIFKYLETEERSI